MTAHRPRFAAPNLRFPEFRSAGDWHFLPLSHVAEPLSEKVGTSKCVPMSVTTGVGLVSQEEKFGRIIAGKSYRSYIRLQTNDFAYNKSATKEFPQGYIARYRGMKDAAVPNSIFACFRPDAAAVIPEYLDHLLHGNHHGRWLRKYITVGARAHGALSVSDDALMSMPIPLPPAPVSRPEQLKIADCLGSLDDLIAAAERSLEMLRRHKTGLMQQLFPQPGKTGNRLRFPEFLDGSTWNELRIGDVCQLKAGDYIPASQIAEHADEGLFPCYGGNGLRGYVRSFTHEGRYVLVGRQGALCGNVNLFAGRFHATEHALVATPNTGIDTGWLFYALDFLNLNRFSTGLAQPGLSVAVLQDVGVAVPTNKGEQQKIADCLGTLDDLITAEGRRLDSLRQHKRGLTQQLFPSLEAQSR
ncbi:MAG: restriction endonuclease subunit S [Gemmatimonadetes bacterium]|nr:restriction endonuclease subunit S [Gemmatimonadota bacterium]